MGRSRFYPVFICRTGCRESRDWLSQQEQSSQSTSRDQWQDSHEISAVSLLNKLHMLSCSAWCAHTRTQTCAHLKLKAVFLRKRHQSYWNRKLNQIQLKLLQNNHSDFHVTVTLWQYTLQVFYCADFPRTCDLLLWPLYDWAEGLDQCWVEKTDEVRTKRSRTETVCGIAREWESKKQYIIQTHDLPFYKQYYRLLVVTGGVSREDTVSVITIVGLRLSNSKSNRVLMSCGGNSTEHLLQPCL